MTDTSGMLFPSLHGELTNRSALPMLSDDGNYSVGELGSRYGKKMETRKNLPNVSSATYI
jgi:hypothetical protein